MEDEKKSRRLSNFKMLMDGERPPINPAGRPLQAAFWDLILAQKISSGMWREMLKDHVNDPMYLKQFRDSKRTTVIDRTNRLMTALTGGSSQDFPADLTWKRFIEGLAVMKQEQLIITIETKRGNFDSVCKVTDGTWVRPDFIKNLRDENKRKRKERFDNTASKDVNVYMIDPVYTYTHVMKHPLLRIIYRLVAGYGITPDNWERWSTNYVNNPKLCPGTSSKRGDRRNNMKQALRHTEAITWRWFLIILQAMDVRKFEITFKVCRGDLCYEAMVEVPLAEYQFWSSNETEQP
ncbi:hypothetical protein pEaSNUABM29_00212 [Erwinia phage pEa_SNUABM_29]|nr:hypothetical protein pEaSNUABM29_00212 [Erwinia phage pEa_SNUABM_29]